MAFPESHAPRQMVGLRHAQPVRRRLRHAPCLARRPEAAPVAAERDQLVVAAVAAAQAQEALRLDAAFKEGVERVLDELRQVGAGRVFGLREEGRGVLLNQAVQRDLPWAMAVVVDRGHHSAPVASAAPWLARDNPEVLSPHGLKPGTSSQSPCVPPAKAYSPLRGLQRVPVFTSDRQLRGNDIRAANASSGSTATNADPR